MSLKGNIYEYVQPLPSNQTSNISIINHSYNMKRFNAPSPSSSSSQSSPLCKKRRSRSSEGSTSDSDHSSSRSQEENGCEIGRGRSDLLLTHLSMFPGEEMQGESIAATNGKSKIRIRQCLNKSLCKCNRKCFKSVSLGMVYQVCVTFWGLTKAAQDCVLWGIQNMSKGSMPSDLKDDADSNDSSSDTSQSSASSMSISSGVESEFEQTPRQVNCWYIQGGAFFSRKQFII